MSATEDQPEPTNRALAFTLAAGMIVFGTASTELSKIQFETKSHGVDSCDADDDDEAHTKDCYFDKPYFNTLIMKFGMSLCYFLYLFDRRQRTKKLETKTLKMDDGSTALMASTDLDDPTTRTVVAAGDSGADDQEVPFSVILRIIIPAFTDLVQTVLAMGGLLFVDPSIYQMCRGSVVIFSAILSVFWLGRRLECRHIIAVGMVLLAILMVGLAGIEDAEAADDDDGGGSSVLLVIIGLLLIIVGQFIGAIQFILEEELMTKLGCPPLLLVAWEGIWGLTIMFILYIPLYYTPADGGDASVIWHENVFDAVVQISNSPLLIATSVISVFVLLTYNVVGNLITKYLNAVARSMLEACRTIGVWTVGLMIYYVGGNQNIGEAWTNWSYLELGGFFFLVYGTLAYKDIVPINPLDLFRKPADKAPGAREEADAGAGDYRAAPEVEEF
uniref:EamA domain-containing protein n=1 Tax=Rhizochromulina marina TaxID=1034831 RepID=A0A7S2RJT3_9STRA